MNANTAVARTTHRLLDRHRAALVGARTHAGHVEQSARASRGGSVRADTPCIDCPAAA